MKRLALTTIIVLLFSLISTITAASYTNVSVTEAKAMIDSNPSLVVLDVRTLSEYDSGHIRNTMHIPLAELGGRLDELNVNDEFLVYCASGGRSASASQLLVDNGFLYIYNMLGGITAWISAGYPVYIKYSSIQEALNNASPGDTILVSAGIYYENVVVNKSLSLIGENSETTLIDGNSIGNVMSITASNVNIMDFSVQNSATAFKSGGIYMSSWGNNVSHNVVKNSLGVPEACGIWLDNSSHNTVYDNSIFSNGLAGIYLEDSSNNTISHNHVFSNPYEGIFLVSSHGNIISGNNISSNMDVGIYLMGSENNTVSYNDAINNGIAIFLEGSDHNLVCYNNASEFNVQSPTVGVGIYLRGSSYCTVSRNIALNNTYGINVCLWSYENVISDNVFSHNDYGIELAVYVANNTVRGNTVSKNNHGIYLADGGSNINIFFHNNFVDNLQNAEAHSPAIWDNGCEGNFWSNYNGTDLNGDGIGDTDLPWEGVDSYPLMNPYWNIGDIDHDLDVDIFDVVKCGIAYGSTPSDPNWNPHCDIAEPYGIVNIFDLVTIAGSYGDEYTSLANRNRSTIQVDFVFLLLLQKQLRFRFFEL